MFLLETENEKKKKTSRTKATKKSGGHYCTIAITL